MKFLLTTILFFFSFSAFSQVPVYMKVRQVSTAPANQPPVVMAGADQAITLPVSSVTLSGSATDANGISYYRWSQTSGPNTATIVDSTSSATGILDLIEGTYVFTLTATDSLGLSASDNVSIVVNSAINILPIAEAGINQTITLPINSVILSGSGTDADGTIDFYLWEFVSGPSGSLIIAPTTDTTAVNGLVAGTYTFKLTVTDNSGATASDNIQIIVNAAINILPIANAGINQDITLPTNSVILSGSGTDADGTIVSYSWTFVSGPSGSLIISPTTDTTTVNGLVAGTYTFMLTVTDNSGGTATDNIQIIVNAAPPINVLPIANAGINQDITLPTSSVILSGSGTDADGTIVSKLWTYVSGPLGSVIVSPTTYTTTVNSLVAGTYVFKLTVTDNSGGTASDNIQIIVSAAINILPISNAGPNQVIVQQ